MGLRVFFTGKIFSLGSANAQEPYKQILHASQGRPAFLDKPTSAPQYYSIFLQLTILQAKGVMSYSRGLCLIDCTKILGKQ